MSLMSPHVELLVSDSVVLGVASLYLGELSFFIRERLIVRIPKMRKSSREYKSKGRSTVPDYYAAKVVASSKVKERKQ